MEYRIIDADSHTNEPGHLWQNRVPASMKEKAPRMIELKDGKVGWSFDGGKRVSPVGLTAVAGLDATQYDGTGTPYDKIRPGSYDPKARLEEMEYDMVQAQVIFPSVAIQGPHAYTDDRELQLACVRAYNDWLYEEFCSVAPDRLIGLPIAPCTGVEDLILEWKRVADRGARGLILSSYPNGTFNPSIEDESFWSEVQDWDYAIHLHFGFFNPPGSAAGTLAGRKPPPTGALLPRLGSSVFKPLADTIYMGLYERFPKIKMVGVETGIGWIPFFLETLDDNFLRHRFNSGWHLKMMPSEYFKRNVWATFVTDPLGVELRHKVGVEHIMWSTDYPHVQTDWPNSQRTLAGDMRNVPEDEVRKMVRDNAVKLYRLE